MDRTFNINEPSSSNPPPPSINVALPEDVLLYIFDRLPLQDLLVRVERVCKRWRPIQRRACQARRTLFLYVRKNSPASSLNCKYSRKFARIQLNEKRLDWALAPNSWSRLCCNIKTTSTNDDNAETDYLTEKNCKWIVARLPRIVSFTLLSCAKNLPNINRILMFNWRGSLERLQMLVLRTENNPNIEHYYCETDARFTLHFLSSLNHAQRLRHLTLYIGYKLFSYETEGERARPVSLFLPILSRLEEFNFFCLFNSSDFLLAPLEHYIKKNSAALKRIELAYKVGSFPPWTGNNLDTWRSKMTMDLRSRVASITPTSVRLINGQLDGNVESFYALLGEYQLTFPSLTHLSIVPGFNLGLAPLLHRLTGFTNLRRLNLLLSTTMLPFNQLGLIQAEIDISTIALPQLHLLNIEMQSIPGYRTDYTRHYELTLSADVSYYFARLFPCLKKLCFRVPPACQCKERCSNSFNTEIMSDHDRLRPFLTSIWRQYVKNNNNNTRGQQRKHQKATPEILLGHVCADTLQEKLDECTECSAIESELRAISDDIPNN